MPEGFLDKGRPLPVRGFDTQFGAWLAKTLEATICDAATNRLCRTWNSSHKPSRSYVIWEVPSLVQAGSISEGMVLSMLGGPLGHALACTGTSAAQVQSCLARIDVPQPQKESSTHHSTAGSGTSNSRSNSNGKVESNNKKGQKDLF